MRPLAHWGTFQKNFSLTDCLGVAEQAMGQRAYQIFDSARDGDSFSVIGGDTEVLVIVVCIPLTDSSTWVVVFASSNNSDLAAAARSQIREHIQKSVRIDDGPVLNPVEE